MKNRIFPEITCPECGHKGQWFVAITGYNGSCERIMQCPKCKTVHHS